MCAKTPRAAVQGATSRRPRVERAREPVTRARCGPAPVRVSLSSVDRRVILPAGATGGRAGGTERPVDGRPKRGGAAVHPLIVYRARCSEPHRGGRFTGGPRMAKGQAVMVVMEESPAVEAIGGRHVIAGAGTAIRAGDALGTGVQGRQGHRRGHARTGLRRRAVSGRPGAGALVSRTGRGGVTNRAPLLPPVDRWPVSLSPEDGTGHRQTGGASLRERGGRGD